MLYFILNYNNNREFFLQWLFQFNAQSKLMFLKCMLRPLQINGVKCHEHKNCICENFYINETDKMFKKRYDLQQFGKCITNNMYISSSILKYKWLSENFNACFKREHSTAYLQCTKTKHVYLTSIITNDNIGNIASISLLQSMENDKIILSRITVRDMYALIQCKRRIKLDTIESLLPEYMRYMLRYKTHQNIRLINPQLLLERLYKFYIKREQHKMNVTLYSRLVFPLIQPTEIYKVPTTFENYIIQPNFCGFRIQIIKVHDKVYFYTKHGIRIHNIMNKTLTLSDSHIYNCVIDGIIVQWSNANQQYYCGWYTGILPPDVYYVVIATDLLLWNNYNLLQYSIEDRMQIMQTFMKYTKQDALIAAPVITNITEWIEKYKQERTSIIFPYFNGFIYRSKNMHMYKIFKQKINLAVFKLVKFLTTDTIYVFNDETKEIQTENGLLIPHNNMPNKTTVIVYKYKHTTYYTCYFNGFEYQPHLIIYNCPIKYRFNNKKIAINNKLYPYFIANIYFYENDNNISYIVPRYDLSLLDCIQINAM